MPKIILKGTITVPDDKLAEMPTMAAEHIRLTRDEPGNIVFDITQDATDPNTWHVYEEFVDKPAFEAHQARNRASAWWQFALDFPRDFQFTEEGS